MTAARRDGAIAFAVGLVARCAVALWGASRFPPAGDGTYYDTFARRLADGAGYTWAWPDGVVTYAAHYPVGYPAILAAAYRIAGPHVVVAMLVNALIGAAAAWATHRLLRESAGRWGAFAGALVVALHPALVPYTAALMTEGVTTALLAVAAAIAVRARGRSGRTWPTWALAGAVLGVATLVRPQSIALAPVLGALAVAPRAAAPFRARVAGAAIVTAASLLVCAPWTARNCVRMKRCALVSVNGGWNLLIGAQTASGAWAPVEVPEACRTVWDEAGKDVCFERAARDAIEASPAAWLARAPAKLAVTFDYFGAAPWYLHVSNPARFDERDKTLLGAVETIAARLLLLAALAAAASRAGPRRGARIAVALVGAIAAVTLHAWIGYLALAFVIALLGAAALEGPLVLPWTAAVIALTALVHAVFFGAGRYGVVVVPFVTAVAFTRRFPIPWLATASRASSTSSGSSSRVAAADSAASASSDPARPSALY